jgi:hypothetical protein
MTKPSNAKHITYNPAIVPFTSDSVNGLFASREFRRTNTPQNIPSATKAKKSRMRCPAPPDHGFGNILLLRTDVMLIPISIRLPIINKVNSAILKILA